MSNTRLAPKYVVNVGDGFIRIHDANGVDLGELVDVNGDTIPDQAKFNVSIPKEQQKALEVFLQRAIDLAAMQAVTHHGTQTRIALIDLARRFDLHIT